METERYKKKSWGSKIKHIKEMKKINIAVASSLRISLIFFLPHLPTERFILKGEMHFSWNVVFK
jgi:hypothetical protein